MAAGLIDKGFHRWIAQKYAFGTRHRRRFPTLFYLLPWPHREQKRPLRSLVLNTYQPTMLRQLFNRSFHFHYHLHFKFDLFFRTYNTNYYSTSLAHRQKHTREAVIMPRGAGPGTQTAEFPETRDILTLLTMIAKEKGSGPSPAAVVPMNFLTAWKPERIYSTTGTEGAPAAQPVQGVPLPGKPGISILPPPHSMSTIQSAPSAPSTYAIQTIQAIRAARAVHQKPPVHPLHPAHPIHPIHPIPSTYLTHLMHTAHVIQAMQAIHQTHIHRQSMPDSPSVPLSFSPFPRFPVSPFLLFLRAPSRSSRLTKIPFRSLVERLMSVPSATYPRRTVRMPRGTIPGTQTAKFPEGRDILTLLTMMAKEKESSPGTIVPMSSFTAREPGRIYLTTGTKGTKGTQGEQEVQGVPVPGKPGISILPPLHIMRTMEAAHSLQTKQTIHKRHLFHPIHLMQRGHPIFPIHSTYSTHPLYSTHAVHPLQLLHLPHSLQQAAASFSAAAAVPGSMQTAVEAESTSTTPPIWPGAATVSMLDSYMPLTPTTLLKPLSTLRTTGFASSAPIETQKTSRAAQSTGTPPIPAMQPTPSILLRPAEPAVPAAAAPASPLPIAGTVPIARTTSTVFTALTALTTRRTARTAGAAGTPGTAGTLRTSFTTPEVSTVPAAPTIPTSPIPTSNAAYGEKSFSPEFKFDYPGALRRSGPSLEYFNPAGMSRPPSAQAAPLDDIGRKTVPGMPRGDTDHLTHESKNVSIHPDSQGISQQMNLSQLTDRVYRMLERKIRMERERRGW